MGKVESILKSEILRLAKREIRGVFRPLRREFRLMRFKLSTLSKNFSVLDRMAKEQMRRNAGQGQKLQATPEEVKVSRLTPERIRNLRLKLGLSQRALASLAGVTLGAVALWEKGKFRPGTDKKATLIALRKLGKREVRKLLVQKSQEKPKKKPKRTRAKRQKKPSRR